VVMERAQLGTAALNDVQKILCRQHARTDIE